MSLRKAAWEEIIQIQKKTGKKKNQKTRVIFQKQ